jgi:hypothetical protein
MGRRRVGAAMGRGRGEGGAEGETDIGFGLRQRC